MRGGRLVTTRDSKRQQRSGSPNLVSTFLERAIRPVPNGPKPQRVRLGDPFLHAMATARPMAQEATIWREVVA